MQRFQGELQSYIFLRVGLIEECQSLSNSFLTQTGRKWRTSPLAKEHSFCSQRLLGLWICSHWRCIVGETHPCHGLINGKIKKRQRCSFMLIMFIYSYQYPLQSSKNVFVIDRRVETQNLKSEATGITRSQSTNFHKSRAQLSPHK